MYLSNLCAKLPKTLIIIINAKFIAHNLISADLTAEYDLPLKRACAFYVCALRSLLFDNFHQVVLAIFKKSSDHFWGDSVYAYIYKRAEYDKGMRRIGIHFSSSQ